MPTASRAHTNREYEQELRRLREQLLRMGAKVEEIITGSIKALLERDSALATRMIDFDRRINQMEVDIDELCMLILAKRQPVASDLRFITMALKLVTDLERIGDLSVNMCERVLELNEEPPLKPYVDLPRMAEDIQSMLREALDAFVAGDPERAQAVIERDQLRDVQHLNLLGGVSIVHAVGQHDGAEGARCRNRVRARGQDFVHAVVIDPRPGLFLHPHAPAARAAAETFFAAPLHLDAWAVRG